MAFIGGLFRRIAGGILEIDDTCVPFEHLEILSEFLSKHNFDFSAKDMQGLLKELKRKHLVDGIVVVDGNGKLVVSSDGNGQKDAYAASALLTHVDSELSLPESVLVKAHGGWLMLFPFNGKTYVVRAQSSLSNIELRALASEIEFFAKKKPRNGK